MFQCPSKISGGAPECARGQETAVGDSKPFGRRARRAYSRVDNVGNLELLAGLQHNGSNPRIVAVADSRKQVVDHLHGKHRQEQAVRTMIQDLLSYDTSGPTRTVTRMFFFVSTRQDQQGPSFIVLDASGATRTISKVTDQQSHLLKR